MVFKEPTTEPKLVMVSSPHEPTHESALALSSPATPSFDSPPAGPSSPLLTLSDSPDPYLQSCHPVYLASSLQKLLSERKEEFHYSFGKLEDSVERLKRDNSEREGVIKFKRDSMVMLDNLIRMQEKEVENLETLVSTAKTGGRKYLPISEVDGACTQNSTAVSPPKCFKQPNRSLSFAAHSMPSAMEPNDGQQLPSAPTSLSLRPFHTLSAISNDSSSVSDRRMPTSPVSNDFPSVQSGERKVSGAEGLPVKKVAKVGREVSMADVPGKKTVKDKRDVSEAGGVKKVSGAEDVTAKKTPKVVASEPREQQTKRLPASTPFKGRVGKLHAVERMKPFNGEGAYWKIVQGGRGRRQQHKLQLACLAVNEKKDDSSRD